MRGVCLDYKMVLSYLFKDEKAVFKVKQISRETPLSITSFTLAEVGLISLRKDVAEMLAEAFEVLSFDKKAALIFREVYDDLEERGKANKRTALEASIAIANDVYLLVRDREEYEGIRGLRILT